MAIGSVTPSGLARLALLVVVLLTVVWLVRNAWQALIPFLVGGILAYALLPVVNWLDRFMPRTLAAILAMLAVLGSVVLIVSRIVPLLGAQVARFIVTLPPRDVVDAELQRLTEYLSGLPPAQQQAVQGVVNQMWVTIQTNALAYLSSFATVGVGALLNFVSLIGFILGLVVIPTWMLTVMTGQRQGVTYLNRTLPGWLKPDFWAVARIIDGPMRAYFNGLTVVALVAGLLMGLGLAGLDFVGLGRFDYPILTGLFVGLLQLIPAVGPAIAYIALLLLGLLVSPQTALMLLILYWVVQRIVGAFVSPRFERKVVDIHPALLAVVVVALSQLGLLWVLLAAPLTAIFLGLTRYAYGRLGDPARPAGLLPGEKPAPAAPPVAVRPVPRYAALAAARRAEAATANSRQSTAGQ
ncbi:MAG: AI-2E family transporter [Anaerolineae bacterium]